MNFDIKVTGRPSPRDRIFIKLLKSPGLRISASEVSKTIFLSSNPNEICEILNLLLQGKQAGNNFNIIIEEFIAIVDKLLVHKCISKKQLKQF